MTSIISIILAAAVLTYLARVGGYLLLWRFSHIHPRVEAGLNAVPAAVLTTLVAPAAVAGGPAEWAALLVGGIVALRAGLLTVSFCGATVLVAMRHLLD